MTKITKLLCLAQLAETDPNSFVCDDPRPRKCVGNCKKIFTPSNEDISTRRPSVYWKQCNKCREYLRSRNKLNLEREKEKKKDEKDGENIQFNLPIYF